MHHLTEPPFVDEFQWVSPLHFVKNEWQNSVSLWCMLQVGPPSLHYCCAVVLCSSIVLPSVGHSSNHEYHCCLLTGQSSGVSNFYHTFKFFIWLTFVVCFILFVYCYAYCYRCLMQKTLGKYLRSIQEIFKQMEDQKWTSSWLECKEI